MGTSFIILGSGQDGGAPQIGQASSATPPRSASSVAVISEAGTALLLDASPDIRAQSHALLRSDRYPTDRKRFVDGVCITHAHMGHYAGLLHFGNEAGAETRLPLFATESVTEFLTANQPWATLFTRGHLDAVPVDGRTIPLDGSLTLTALPVPHRDEFSDTVGFSVSVDERPWLLYVPDIDSWTLWGDAEEQVARHDHALIDATFSSAAELPWRDIGAIQHPLVSDTIARFGHLTAETNIILTHINHSNPLGDPVADITREALTAGFALAHDGLEVSDIE